MKQYALKYSKNLFQSTVFPLKEVTSIGRDSENTIHLNSPEISRKHAEITLQEGQWVLHDLMTKNRTFVNDKMIKKQPLKPGDRLRIGPILTLQFIELNAQEDTNTLVETLNLATPLGLAQEVQDPTETVKTFMDALPLGIAILNGQMEVRLFNRALALFMMSENQEEIKHLSKLLGCSNPKEGDLHCGTSPKCKKCSIHAAVERAFREGVPSINYEISWQNIGRTSSFYIRFSLIPLSYSLAGESMVVLTWEDITLHKLSLNKLKRDASYEELTGLPNRAVFMNRLRHSIKRAKQNGDYLFVVLFLDLDRFKIINDNLGREFGDQMLLVIARILKICLRPEDTVTRLGGDEFAILIDDMKSIDEALKIVHRIEKKLQTPFNLNGQDVFTTASIGIVFSQKGYDWPEDLLRDANTAMNRAKSLGRARYEIFDTGMHSHTKKVFKLETELRQALQRQDFVLYYQPIVSVETYKITGAEALLRWEHPQRGLVFPENFIPIAEETGLITPIGEWVLQTAYEQNRVWHAAGFPSLRVTVNLSNRQFRQQNLTEYITEFIKRNALDPHLLSLELTESYIMENAEETIKTLHELSSMGIQIYIDDFGTGYSSLAYLKHFPIDNIKIDKSFIRDITTEPGDAAITKAIIAMAHSLNINVIAEGVETEEQLEVLRCLQCNHVQGYFFSMPVSAEDFTKLLKEGSGFLSKRNIISLRKKKASLV